MTIGSEMEKRMKKKITWFAFTAAIAALGCAAPEAESGLREELEAASSDPALREDRCAEVGAEPDCDLCEAHALYDDGVCDDWCDRPDLDCADEERIFCGYLPEGEEPVVCPEGTRCVEDPELPDIAYCEASEEDRVPCGGYVAEGEEPLTCPDGMRCVEDPELPDIAFCEPAEEERISCGGYVAEGEEPVGCPDGTRCVEDPEIPDIAYCEPIEERIFCGYPEEGAEPVTCPEGTRCVEDPMLPDIAYCEPIE